MTTEARNLIVAFIKKWRAEELSTNTLPRWKVRGSLGLDVPYIEPNDVHTVRWWSPQEHAARVLHSGLPLPLLSIPPDWLQTIPPKYVKRDIWVGTIDALTTAPNEAWFKPASMKYHYFPAGRMYRNDVERLRDGLRPQKSALSTHGMIVQASGDMSWEWEARSWIRDSRVLSTCVYLAAGIAWEPTTEADDGRALAAGSWTQNMLDAGIPVPPGCVIDVGWNNDTGFSVVEANPAWASSWYGVKPNHVLNVLDLSIDWSAAHPEWAWQPDPVLLRRAHNQPPLPVRTAP